MKLILGVLNIEKYLTTEISYNPKAIVNVPANTKEHYYEWHGIQSMRTKILAKKNREFLFFQDIFIWDCPVAGMLSRTKKKTNIWLDLFYRMLPETQAGYINIKEFMRPSFEEMRTTQYLFNELKINVPLNEIHFIFTWE